MADYMETKTNVLYNYYQIEGGQELKKVFFPLNQMKNFAEILEYTAKRLPDKTALVCAGRRCSYRQLWEEANRVAAALVAEGIGPGDKVALLTPNSVEFISVVFGCAKVGAIAVKLNWRLAPEELKYLADVNDIKLMFYRYNNEKWRSQLHDMLLEDKSKIMTFISLDETEKCERSFAQFIEGMDPDYGCRFHDEHASLMHLHTSGASGKPKTVVYSHRSFLDQIGTCVGGLEFYEDMVFLSMSQMFHSAVSGIYSCIAAGATAVVFRKYDPQAYLQAVSDEHITRLSAIPTVLQSLLRQPNLDEFDLSAVKTVGYSAAPVSPALIDEAVSKFNCGLMQSYGMTEMGSIVTILKPEDHLRDNYKHLYTVGKPLQGVQVRIVDDNGDDCPVKISGQIVLKGPGMMVEYYKQPEKTAEVLRNGWYYSDDLGYLDEEGFLTLCGRKSDLIITGGENVFSKEVENVLAARSDIKESCVFGTPDELWGEVVTACVELEEGCQLSPQEIHDYCHEKIAGYKVPKKIVIVQSLPCNAVGKLDKPAIVDLYTKGQMED